MGSITYIAADGTRTVVEGKAGQSIMRIALDAKVPGIVGECGGVLSCATCHCFLEDSLAAQVPPPSDDEKVMIDCAIDPRESSRLSCQVIWDEALNGIEVTLPAAQY